jgi:hypothetical protein
MAEKIDVSDNIAWDTSRNRMSRLVSIRGNTYSEQRLPGLVSEQIVLPQDS